MDREHIVDAISYLDDDILAETAEVREKPKGKGTSNNRITMITRKPWFKITAAAAALVLIVIGGSIAGNRAGISNKAMKDTGAESFSRGDVRYYSETAPEMMVDEAVYDSKMAKPLATAAPSMDGTYPNAVSDNAMDGGEYLFVAASVDIDLIETFATADIKDGVVKGTLGFELSEKADYYVSASMAWWLEKQENESWEMVDPIQAPSFAEAAYVVGEYAGTNRFTQEFDLSGYKDIRSGEYRIGKTIVTHKMVDGVEQLETEVIYSYFSVK